MIRCLVLILMVMGAFWQTSSAQIATDAHTVTLQVNQITLLAVSSAALNLTIDGSVAIPGQDLMVVTDQTTMLLWGTNASAQKVTVNTSLAAPLFTLRVVALSPSVGTPAPEVTVNTVPTDFILNIGRSSGSSQMRYTGEALASQGVGTDTHIITFTIVAQ